MRGDPYSLIGRVIQERYRVQARIAEGGQAYVYSANHVFTGHAVALKIMRPEIAGDERSVARFRREALASTRLSHPHNVRVYDVGQTVDGLWFLAMEYLDGRNLRRVLKDEAPLHPLRALRIARDVCQALTEAHNLGMVHRDLKPSNIYLCAHQGLRDWVKVLDFGIVAFIESFGADEHITAPGLILGTPAYWSPEQMLGEPLDGRSDLYALGTILFEMLTGDTPFPSAPGARPIDRTATDAPGLPAAVAGTEMPESLRRLVASLLARHPAERLASAQVGERAMDDVIAELTREQPDEANEAPTLVDDAPTLVEGSPRGAVHRSSAGPGLSLPVEAPQPRPTGPVQTGSTAPASGTPAPRRAGTGSRPTPVVIQPRVQARASRPAEPLPEPARREEPTAGRTDPAPSRGLPPSGMAAPPSPNRPGPLSGASRGLRPPPSSSAAAEAEPLTGESTATPLRGRPAVPPASRTAPAQPDAEHTPLAAPRASLRPRPAGPAAPGPTGPTSRPAGLGRPGRVAVPPAANASQPALPAATSDNPERPAPERPAKAVLLGAARATEGPAPAPAPPEVEVPTIPSAARARTASLVPARGQRPVAVPAARGPAAPGTGAPCVPPAANPLPKSQPKPGAPSPRPPTAEPAVPVVTPAPAAVRPAEPAPSRAAPPASTVARPAEPALSHAAPPAPPTSGEAPAPSSAAEPPRPSAGRPAEPALAVPTAPAGDSARPLRRPAHGSFARVFDRRSLALAGVAGLALLAVALAFLRPPRQDSAPPAPSVTLTVTASAPRGAPRTKSALPAATNVAPAPDHERTVPALPEAVVRAEPAARAAPPVGQLASPAAAVAPPPTSAPASADVAPAPVHRTTAPVPPDAVVRAEPVSGSGRPAAAPASPDRIPLPAGSPRPTGAVAEVAVAAQSPSAPAAGATTKARPAEPARAAAVPKPVAPAPRVVAPATPASPAPMSAADACRADIQRGIASSRRGRHDLALRYFGRAVEVCPDNRAAKMYLQRAREQLPPGPEPTP